jgi:lipoyl(octanoyl) transferase
MEQGRTFPVGSARWRILVSRPADGAENMAIDEALLDRARVSGECVLRLYEWVRPTLSLGRNQTARGHYDLTLARDLGVDFVRRQTGGRAVLHHRELTYSVTGPAALLGSLRESYARVNRLLVAGLRRLGVAASVAPAVGRAPGPGLSPCFDTPGEGELVLGPRKLVGSAQWRDDEAFLQHGSVLIDDDQALASRLLSSPAAPPPPSATLRDALGHAPTVTDLAAALQDALVTHEDADASPLVIDDALRSLIDGARVRFLDEHWTWRR